MTIRFTVAILALATAGSAALLQAQPAPMAPAVRPADYLAKDRWPDSVKLLPPPPAEGSLQSRVDAAGEKRALALRGTARWDLARADADLGPQAMAAFSCAAGRRIGPDDTPVTDRLLRRAMIDFGGSTAAAKDLYKRPRPFMVNNQPSCTPESEAGLRTNGSYPSGHAAAGYGSALVLARLIPSHASALLLRGAAYGDSRRVCNVHWASDVAGGQKMARAVWQQLQADPAFRADLAAARAELMHKGAAPDAVKCRAERSALAMVRR